MDNLETWVLFGALFALCFAAQRGWLGHAMREAMGDGAWDGDWGSDPDGVMGCGIAGHATTRDPQDEQALRARIEALEAAVADPDQRLKREIDALRERG